MMWLGISSKVDQNKSPFFDMVTLNWGSKSMHFFKAGNQYPGVTPSAVLTLRMFQELNLKKEYTSLKPCEWGIHPGTIFHPECFLLTGITAEVLQSLTLTYNSNSMLFQCGILFTSIDNKLAEKKTHSDEH